MSVVFDAMLWVAVSVVEWFFGELSERPRWLRRLIATLYVVFFAGCLVAAVVLLT